MYISADVEGVAGISGWHQIMPGSEDYAIGRALMTAEVNAAIEGAFAGGAERVVVNDAHSRMSNLLPAELDPRARLVSGHFKPLYMLQGLDDSFGAAFFIGYHGAIGEPEAILSHTYNPRAIWEARIDGQEVGEIGINLLVCRYFGVPVRLVTGDGATAREARAAIPSVHTAEVKRSFSRYSAESLSPAHSRDLIRTEAEASLAAVPIDQPSRQPVEIDLLFQVADMASMAEWVRGVQRTGPRGVRISGSDGLEAYRTFYTIIMLTRSIVE